jgi:L-alanine-DL-glutamate epimerase-like enolase superfamily enzyme
LLAAAPALPALSAVPKARITAIRAIFTGFVYVKVETDAGVFGVGDGSCSDRDFAVIETIHKHFAPALIGRDPTRIEFIWQDIFRGNFWVAGPIMQSALSGIDMALWDIFGKLTGLPVYRLLGGAARDRVLVYRHVYGEDTERLAATAKQMVAQGYRAIRLSPPGGKIFEAPRVIRDSVQAMRAVREAVGDDIEIAFDAHTRFSPQQGIELCERLLPYRPFFVEDPIRAENMASYRLIRSHTRAPLAAGEQLTHMWQFRELIEEDLVDFLRVDQSHCGGISHARKIAAMGEAHYQEMAVHYTGSPVNSAANFHLNMAIPNCAVQEFAPASGALAEVTPNAYAAKDGYLEPVDRPGFGLEFNEAAALKLESKLKDKPSTQLLNLRRPDGSVNNW